MAELLDISPATVETHRARILQKLDIHSIAELVLYAVRRGCVFVTALTTRCITVHQGASGASRMRYSAV